MRDGFVLDLGKIYDVDESYVNGKLIGKTGSFPPEYISMGGERRVYYVPRSSLEEKNILAVRVFNGVGMGGMIDVPMVPLRIQEESRIRTPSELEEAVTIRLARGQTKGAEALCERFAREAQSEELRSAGLILLTRTYLEKGEGERALESFREFCLRYTKQYAPLGVFRSILQLTSKKALSSKALFLGEDNQTKMNWVGRYGNSGFILFAMAGYASRDLFGVPGEYGTTRYERNAELPEPRPMSYMKETSESGFRGYAWRTAYKTRIPGALYNPLTGLGDWLYWDDTGERHPFDNLGPDLILTLSIPEGVHILSAYFAQRDWWCTSRPTHLSVVLFDESSEPIALAGVTKPKDGVYERFLVHGPAKLKMRVYKHSSNCSFLNAVFLDKVAGLPPLAELVGRENVPMDEETQKALETIQEFLSAPESIDQVVSRIERAREALGEVKDRGLAGQYVRWILSEAGLRPHAERETNFRVLLRTILSGKGGVRAVSSIVERLVQQRSLGLAMVSSDELLRFATAREIGKSELKLVEEQWDAWKGIDPHFGSRLVGAFLARVRAKGYENLEKVGVALVERRREEPDYIEPTVKIPDRMWMAESGSGYVEVVGAPSTKQLTKRYLIECLKADKLSEAGKKVVEDLAVEDCRRFYLLLQNKREREAERLIGYITEHFPEDSRLGLHLLAMRSSAGLTQKKFDFIIEKAQWVMERFDSPPPRASSIVLDGVFASLALGEKELARKFADYLSNARNSNIRLNSAILLMDFYLADGNRAKAVEAYEIIISSASERPDRKSLKLWAKSRVRNLE